MQYCPNAPNSRNQPFRFYWVTIVNTSRYYYIFYRPNLSKYIKAHVLVQIVCNHHTTVVSYGVLYFKKCIKT